MRIFPRRGALVALLLVACALPPPSGLEVATTLPATPSGVAAYFFGELAQERFASLGNVVMDDQIPLLSLTETDRLPEVVAGLADESVLAANYWESFASAVEGLTGGRWQDVRMVGESKWSGRSRTFVVVEVRLEGGGPETRRVVLQEHGGAWMVDPLATFSPAVASRLLASVASLLEQDSADGDRIVEAFRDNSISLEAAAVLWPPEITGDETRLALLRLADLLGSKS